MDELTCLNRGSAVSMYVAIVGRFIASIGGAGMVDLVSILLNSESNEAREPTKILMMV